MTASQSELYIGKPSVEFDSFKICTICEQCLPIEEFKKWSRICKPCTAKRKRLRASELQLLEENILTHKNCNKCKECKPVDDFRKSNQTKDGLKAWCRKCENLYENNRIKSINYPFVDDGRLKICSTCRVSQPLSNFHKSKRYLDGVKGQCKSCRSAESIDFNKRNKEKMMERYALVILKHEQENTTKVCSNKDCTFKGLPQPWTRFYRNSRVCDGLQSYCMDCFIEKALIKRFNVGKDWYRETLEKQGGKCSICGSTDPKNSSNTFAIDHDHSCCPSGYSCGKCIRGLLCFTCNTRLAYLENSVWNRAAMVYLNKHKKGNHKHNDIQELLFTL